MKSSPRLSAVPILATLLMVAEMPSVQAQAQVQAQSPVAPPSPVVVAQVLSVTSIPQPVSPARLICSDVGAAAAPTSGAGAVVGALMGAAVGSQVGGGAGQALATAAGAVGGALLGDRAEQGDRTVPVRTCVADTTPGPQLAFQVVYEYAGQPYTTVLPYHPGATLNLQLSPVGSGTAMAPVVSVMPPPVVVYDGPAWRPAPVVVGVGLGWGRPYRGWHGGWHGGHRRWR